MRHGNRMMRMNRMRTVVHLHDDAASGRYVDSHSHRKNDRAGTGCPGAETTARDKTRATETFIPGVRIGVVERARLSVRIDEQENVMHDFGISRQYFKPSNVGRFAALDRYAETSVDVVGCGIQGVSGGRL